MKNTNNEVISWIKSIFFALLLAVICRQFIFTPVTVFGESMMPTFEDQNRVVVTKMGKVNRFDMIVFHSPISDENYIKRVIGLPGDSVEMINDTLYINGKKYSEPYLKFNKEQLASDEKLTGDFDLKSLLGKSVVPKNSLFVMGDNRRRSADSRLFGFIKEDSVIGKAKFRFYPLNEIGSPK